MSFEDAAKAVEGRLQTNWTATPIKFENVPFKETASAYIALFLKDGEGTQITLGSPALRRWPGIIMVQVFVPERTGIQQARNYADGIGAIFDRQQFSQGNSGVFTCRIPSIEMVGVNQGWLQVNVTIPYHRDRQY